MNFLESFNAKKGYQGTGHSQGAAPVSKNLSQSYDLQVTMYGLVFEIYFDKVRIVDIVPLLVTMYPWAVIMERRTESYRRSHAAHTQRNPQVRVTLGKLGVLY